MPAAEFIEYVDTSASAKSTTTSANNLQTSLIEIGDSTDSGYLFTIMNTPSTATGGLNDQANNEISPSGLPPVSTRKKNSGGGDNKSFGSIFNKIKLRRGELAKEPSSSSLSTSKANNNEPDMAATSKTVLTDNSFVSFSGNERRPSESSAPPNTAPPVLANENNQSFFNQFFYFNKRKKAMFGRKPRPASLSIEMNETSTNDTVIIRNNANNGSNRSSKRNGLLLPSSADHSVTQALERRLDTKTSANTKTYNVNNNSLLTATSFDDKNFGGEIVLVSFGETQPNYEDGTTNQK